MSSSVTPVRAWWETPGWIDYGDTPTYVSATQFTVTGDKTSTYEVGRRVRAINEIGTTIYGTVTVSSYSTTTAVTVAWDGDELDSTLAEVAVGAAGIANTWLSFANLSGKLDSDQLPEGFVFETGDYKATARTTASTGWLMCFGQAVSRSTYSDLYGVIGTTYGSGDGSTTFNVPDLRGRSLFGKDDMGGSAANRVTSGVSGITGTTLGAAGGSEAMHGHTHTASVTDPGHTHTAPKATVGFSAAGGATNYVNGTADTGSSMTGISVSNSSTGAGSSQNMPPALIVNWMIKT